MRALLALCFVATCQQASAAPLMTTDDDQKTILAICRIAAKSPVVGDEDTAGIAQFCVAWKAKMQAAKMAEKTESIGPETKPE